MMMTMLQNWKQNWKKKARTNMDIAAIFDVDGTIFRDSLLLRHMDKCVDYDVFPSKVKEEVKPYYHAWKNRELGYEEYLEHAVRIYTEYLKGKTIEDIQFVAKQVIKKDSKKLYRYTAQRIKWHKDQGHKIVFISGSPNYLVEPLAKELGIDIQYSTLYQTDNGTYTGDVIPMWDKNSKRKALNDLKEYYNIDIDNSYAYGDTMGDLTMLTTVGNPIAINPNQKLLNKLQELEKDVKIIVERKDVIYRIN